jgi:hypothetical protein
MIWRNSLLVECSFTKKKSRFVKINFQIMATIELKEKIIEAKEISQKNLVLV